MLPAHIIYHASNLPHPQFHGAVLEGDPHRFGLRKSPRTSQRVLDWKACAIRHPLRQCLKSHIKLRTWKWLVFRASRGCCLLRVCTWTSLIRNPPAVGTSRDLHEHSFTPGPWDQPGFFKERCHVRACMWREQVDRTSSIVLSIARAMALEVRGVLSSGTLKEKGI